MKKELSISLAALLILGNVVPVASAQEITPSKVNVVAQNDGAVNTGNRFFNKVHIEELTLEEAIRYGMEHNYQLKELEINLDMLKINERILLENMDDMEDALDYLTLQRDKLKRQLRDLEDMKDITPPSGEDGTETGETPDPTNQIEEQIEFIRKQIYQLEDQESTSESAKSQLQNQLDTVDLNKTSLANNQEMLLKSMEVSISSIFLNLIMIEDQINFMKDTLETQKQQVEATKIKFQLGLVSRKDFDKATREITELESKIAQLENQLKTEKANFAASIGVTYTGDYTLVKPELGNLVLVTQQKSTEELIKNSYNMENARNTISVKEKVLERIEDDEDASYREVELAELEVEIAKLQLESLEIQLESAINKAYLQLKQQYQALQDAEEKLKNAQVDNGDLHIYFDLGLLSKNDFDAANISVKQAELNYNSAKYQYYLLTKQAELMEKGVISTN
ncbi:MAG: TolC family protein [Lysinibacillus sp.]|nr:TolC family protein [Lysinibacillus sp.]